MHFLSVLPHSDDFFDDEIVDTVNEFTDSITANLQLCRTRKSVSVDNRNDNNNDDDDDYSSNDNVIR